MATRCIEEYNNLITVSVVKLRPVGNSVITIEEILSRSTSYSIIVERVQHSLKAKVFDSKVIVSRTVRHL